MFFKFKLGLFLQNSFIVLVDNGLYTHGTDADRCRLEVRQPQSKKHTQNCLRRTCWRTGSYKVYIAGVAIVRPVRRPCVSAPHITLEHVLAVDIPMRAVHRNWRYVPALAIRVRRRRVKPTSAGLTNVLHILNCVPAPTYTRSQSFAFMYCEITEYRFRILYFLCHSLNLSI